MRYLAQILALALAWFLTDLLVLWPGLLAHGDILLVYPTMGLGIGLLIVLGPNRWPGVMLGSAATTVYFLLVRGSDGEAVALPWTVALAVNHIAAQVTIAAFAALAVRRLTGPAPPLHDLRSTVAFLAVVGLAAPLVSTLWNVPLTWASGKLGGMPLPLAAWHWFMADLIGNVVVAPLVVRWLTPAAWARLNRSDLWRGPLLLVALIGIGLVTFTPLVPRLHLVTVAGLAVGLPLMAWLTVAYGQLGATAALFVGAATAVGATAAGAGPFATLDPVDRFGTLDLAVSALAVTLLLLGAVVSERLSQQHELANQSAQLASQRDRLRRLTARVIATEQRERRDLATRLHDTVGQYLALAQVRLAKLDDSPSPDGHGADLAAVRDNLTRAIDAGRDVIADLSPPTLHGLGLVPALHQLARRFEERHGLTVTVTAEVAQQRGPFEIESFFYRTARELLFNTLKHAHAHAAGVEVAQNEHEWHITVWDDGTGFDGDAALDVHRDDGDAFGLYSVYEQATGLGGSLAVHCDGLTRVAVRVPAGWVEFPHLGPGTPPAEARLEPTVKPPKNPTPPPTPLQPEIAE